MYIWPFKKKKEGKAIKPVVMGILVREAQGTVRIMTQWRKVNDHSYDPLYDQTWEVVGETVRPGESVIDALVRGIREECGVAIDSAWIDTGGKKRRTNKKGEDVRMFNPFTFVQSVGEPQLWIGPVFVVRVPEKWEPNYEKADGEATKHKWWDPSELLWAMQEHPEQFMGLHAPALQALAREQDALMEHYRGSA